MHTSKKSSDMAVRALQEKMKLTLAERPHVYYLQDSGCELRGVQFYGSPWCNR